MTLNTHMYDELVVEHQNIYNLLGVNGEVFEFVVGDRSHVLRDDILLASLSTDKHLKSHLFDRDDYKVI